MAADVRHTIYVMPEQPVDFSGVRLKQARAEVHIDALQAEVANFMARNPFDFRHTTEVGDAGATVHRVLAVVRESPPLGWATIIGDAVHNLRSALDHALWAMADPAERNPKAQFPICSSEEEYNGKARRWLRGVSPRRCDLIRGEQPFLWPEPNRQWHELALLQWLDNDDKHRTLHTVAVVSDFAWIATDTAKPTITYLAEENLPLAHGAEVMRFEMTSDDRDQPADAMPHIDLGISIEDTFGAGMVNRLRSIANHLQHHVFLPLEQPDVYNFLPVDPPDRGS